MLFVVNEQSQNEGTGTLNTQGMREMAITKSYDELRTWYLEYLATVQSYNFDALDKFVTDDFIMQGQKVGLAGFQSTLRTTLQNWPGLRWMPRRIAIDMHTGPTICGWFDMSHGGKDRDGGEVHFQEMAVYTMRDGKLADVEVMFRGPAPAGGPDVRVEQPTKGGSKLSKL